MTSALDDRSLDQIFGSARTFNGWAGTRIKSNFICSIGYADPASVFPRNPRLTFEEAGQWA